MKTFIFSKGINFEDRSSEEGFDSEVRRVTSDTRYPDVRENPGFQI